MMIFLDCETYREENGKLIPDLNADFTLGVLYFENDKYEIYYNKNELWNRLLELGKKEAKRKKVLNVYAHNHNFDFSKYANQNDINIVRFCESPFIYAYRVDRKPFDGKEGKKEIIKFLDTMAIYRMALKKIGEIIGTHKTEMPEDEEATLENIAKYCVQDCKVGMDAIKKIKEYNKREGINVKRIYTINQIAGNNLLNMMKKYPSKHIFDDPSKNKVYETYRKEEVHEAYRGGRCEAFQTGEFEDVTYIDKNSLYPYASTLLKNLPHLRSERKIHKPLKFTTKDELFSKWGYSRCLIKNVSNDYGLLSIRTPTGNYYPKTGTTMIGTWSHIELELAKKEGYKIIDIEWSVIYTETGHNVFTNIMPKLYEKRMNANNPFENYYFKMMMNAGIGKLAQHRNGQEIVVDDMEKMNEYFKMGYELLEGIDNSMNYKFIKKHNNYTKPYYMPIIPVYVNAMGRILMYEQYKKIPLSDLLYTDTDSIIFKGNHLNKFEISEGWGKFKLEGKNKILIYGRKSYAFGDDVKLAGFKKRGLTYNDFKAGKVKNLKMISFNTQNEEHKIGTFIEEDRDLHKQLENYECITKELNEKDLLIDSNLTDISYFIPKLTKIL